MDRTHLLQETMALFQSPFYFYDLDQFESHLRSIRDVLHPDIRVFYATKANPLLEILRILNKNGFGVDVASLGELQQAHAAKVAPKNLIATGPAKSKNYLASLMQAEVETIVIESHNQLKDLNDLAQKLGRKQEVLLRVQLDWDEEHQSVLGGGSVTPFGLGVEDWKKIDLAPYTHVQVKGLHCFQWGNVLDLPQLERVWDMTMRQCRELAHAMGINLEVLDLGGGLGLSYSDNREVQFKDAHDLLLRLKGKHELKEIWLELGRFSIGKFGSYFTRIVDVKTVRGKDLIVTEGGINHMARPALVGEPFPCEAFLKQDLPKKTYTVHGPLCTALDNLGTFELPHDLRPGDWLQFNRVGAYGFSESMPYFLCHHLVGEVILYKGELMVPRAPTPNLEWML